jgi:hypothetical protein
MSGTDDNTYDYKTENDLFNTLFRRSNQLRIGIEGRVHSTYYVRAGYSLQQSPLSDEALSVNSPTQGWSTGIGYRDDHLFADLALSSQTVASSYYMYDPALVEETRMKNHLVRILLSVGARF